MGHHRADRRSAPPSRSPRGPAISPVPAAVGVAPTARATLVRLARYSGVSAVSTTTSLATLGVLVGLAGMPATWSNVIATAVGTVPSFELNRRWVWHVSGRRALLGQILPFCALSFTGLALSTLAVGAVSARTSGWGHWGHTAAVMAANAAAYGSLWVVQYLLLDRVLFREPATGPWIAAARDFSAGGQTAPGPDGTGAPMLRDGDPGSLVAARGALVAAQGGNDHG